jgi:hypothetical protein
LKPPGALERLPRRLSLASQHRLQQLGDALAAKLDDSSDGATPHHRIRVPRLRDQATERFHRGALTGQPKREGGAGPDGGLFIMQKLGNPRYIFRRRNAAQCQRCSRPRLRSRVRKERAHLARVATILRLEHLSFLGK